MMPVQFKADEFLDETGVAHRRELLSIDLPSGDVAVRVATPEDRARWPHQYEAFKNPKPGDPLAAAEALLSEVRGLTERLDAAHTEIGERKHAAAVVAAQLAEIERERDAAVFEVTDLRAQVNVHRNNVGRLIMEAHKQQEHHAAVIAQLRDAHAVIEQLRNEPHGSERTDPGEVAG